MNRRRLGLAARLFAAQLLVVAVGAATLAMVAALVGPSIFHDHLSRAVGTDVPAETSHHVEEAYASAGTVSLGVALVAALAAALAASAYLARRVAHPVAALADAATDVADGQYDVTVPTPGLGGEFDRLTAAFNRMAAQLAAVEATRRGLLADLAHEMRTPLSTLDAYLEAAEDGVSVPDEDATGVMRAQTARLRRLADDIAAVSRAEEHQLDLHPRRVSPAALVDAAVAAARARYADKGITLRAETAPGLPDVSVDADRIGQALGNLLDNALRHTPPGGTVTVTARAADSGAASGAVSLAVADTGDGVAAEHLPHLFERFYRTDAARDSDHGGSGIGLAIVRAIVASHGGRVGADSPGPGRGAAFTITLPATARGR